MFTRIAREHLVEFCLRKPDEALRRTRHEKRVRAHMAHAVYLEHDRVALLRNEQVGVYQP